MSVAKKIANKNYEESAALSTCSFSRHGLGRASRRIKRALNRAAKKEEARLDFRDEEESVE